ncbi:Mrp family chromosome partitioning ATPase [Arthrobacter sp. BE255]|nr:Mrp family chromosome partitioning ATPase [Arthrobacter sp. BE255]
MERNAGLTTALLGTAELDDLLQPWGDDNLYVLTSGQIPPNPSELLGSDEMKDIITRLENVFDTVVIDTSPLLPVTDAAVLSQHAGGVVLVVGVQRTRQQELQKSIDALQMVGADVLGIVLNLLPVKGPDAYSYSYYSYTATEAATNDASARRRRGRSAKVDATDGYKDSANNLTGDIFDQPFLNDAVKAPGKFPRDRVPGN